MAEIIEAVYERGVLRPLQPLNLREQQSVRIQVLEEEGPAESEEIVRLLVTAGLMQPPLVPDAPPPLSEEDRQALADELGRMPGPPLSELVIAERGER